VNRNRLILVGAAVGAAAVLSVILILVVGRGSSDAAATTPTTATAAKDPLAGIPQKGNTLGKASALATLVVYEDPQCPFCRSWNVSTLPSVVDQFVRTGRLKLEYRGVVIIGQDSVRGLRAIYAAGRQNKLWNMADALYAQQGAENSGWITDDVIRLAASQAGADGAAILKTMGSPAVNAALVAAQKQAAADKLQGTPTFIIERPAPALPQPLKVQALDPATFDAALSAVLQ
jgi:protein-disulfide isomerase